MCEPMVQYNDSGFQIYFVVQGIKDTCAFEDLKLYDNMREAIAYAEGYASNPDMGGFDGIYVKAYAHEDGPYWVWYKSKGE